MMIAAYDRGQPTQSYKDYKNRAMEKFRNRVREIVSGIRQNSLKPEDKKKLKDELIAILQEL